ncbi:phasin family protein [Novosphingopyxis sp.]|uniref:phasin family protein n=1 Tax=Novosphingopyxis sp. TaxID=2709690 RepID=UPI003B5957A6
MTARKTAPKSKAPASGNKKAAPAERTAKPSAKVEASPKTAAKADDAKVEAKAEAPKAAAKPAETPKVAAKTEEPKAADVAKDIIKQTAPAEAPQKAVTRSIEKGNTIMANTTAKMTDQTSKIMGDMSERAKAASEKTTQMMTQAGEFSRGNVEAFVEAGKIGAEGVQEMGRENMEFAKKSFETASSSMKDFTSVKSPTELFQLQGEYARKNFDVMVEQASKNTEKMVKLFGDMFQPLSSRMAEAGEKMKIDA